MNCPRCDSENHDHAQACLYCQSPLTYIPEVEAEPDVRTSRLAVASAILAVLSIPGFIIFYRGPATWGYSPYYPYPLGASVTILAYASFGSAVSAVLAGLAGLACIEIKYGRLTGRGWAAIGVAIPLMGFCVMTTRATIANMRGTAYRMTCAGNLSGLGKAMFLYANDYDDDYPRAGGPNSVLGTTANFQANSRYEAFGCDNRGKAGQASMSANFYLLVKFADVTPKSFRCDRDRSFKEFTLADYNISNKELYDLWDFGPDPAKHVSFCYHVPYSSYALTIADAPGVALAADRNPWLLSPAGSRPKKDFQAFDPNGVRKIVKRANALSHGGDGQNVLFNDCHTAFERESFCGVNDDNIYTPQRATDIRKGVLPTLTSQPANKTDSLLMQDPPKGGGE